MPTMALSHKRLSVDQKHTTAKQEGDGISASTLPASGPATLYSGSRRLRGGWGGGHVTKVQPINFNLGLLLALTGNMWLLPLPRVCWGVCQHLPGVIFATMLQEPKQRMV